MRILMLTQFYPPIVGGEEQSVRTLSHALAARGHDVSVATLATAASPLEEVDQRVRIYRMRTAMQHVARLYSDPTRPHAPPFPDPQATANLLRIIRREQPHIVHAHNWLVHSFLPIKALTDLPLVVSLHDYSFACAQKRLMVAGRHCDGPALPKCVACAVNHYGVPKGIVTALANRAMSGVEKRFVDLFLPVSQAVAVGNGLVAAHLPYRVVPNFLPDHVPQSPDDMSMYMDQLPEGDFLLFVGDLVYEKGIDVLLAAYQNLERAPPLVLIGRTREEALRRLPPNVHTLGIWPHAAVTQAWRRCLFGVVPSVWAEPFGIVAIEAMAGGRAIIASRVGGLADIVADGVTGLLVPSNDTAALQAAMVHLLENPQLREAMGAAALHRVNSSYRASAVLSQIEDAYQEVVRGTTVQDQPVLGASREVKTK
jgi:glycosyltransferase involved in cell wall biosynthesis